MSIRISASNSACCSSLIYSTGLGGIGFEFGLSLAVDTSGNAYVTGDTDSTDFPLQFPFQPPDGGNIDAFVAKISSGAHMATD